jgi:hypothetical protein
MESLKNLRDKIQTLEKIHQLHILKILIENNISYTENSNGVFINMITLNEDVSNSIEKYLEYVSLQEDHLGKVETEKNKYLDEMEKDNKETLAVLS